jgi:hypothetical protein
MAAKTSSTTQRTRAQEIFLQAAPELQELIRAVLVKEREEQFKQRRPDIHRALYNHVRTIIQ